MSAVSTNDNGLVQKDARVISNGVNLIEMPSASKPFAIICVQVASCSTFVL
jgi:hypothetical protein